ncbi:hypothetical protein RAE06_11360 [Corynebacterium tuberculostearicum]|uniref:hypothetical protein n=1 Tax=Corynebacterium tuberculostearicum TaxID=38304 RepID=UPI002934906F|nr:hypothetical protein [Corynebacterium tuberculostearicum]MDV2429469.1 hypothetical protein [Corynebacterium tuberculostearicum]
MLHTRFQESGFNLDLKHITAQRTALIRSSKSFTSLYGVLAFWVRPALSIRDFRALTSIVESAFRPVEDCATCIASGSMYRPA